MAIENNNDIHTLSSSQYSENSSGIAITSNLGEGKRSILTQNLEKSTRYFVQ